MSNLEQTLSIIKPDAVERNLENEIKEMFKSKGFSILKEKKIQIEKSEAEKFYKVHETKPFYNDLCDYLSSGPIVVMVLEKENAVLGNRELMGATNPKDAEEGSSSEKIWWGEVNQKLSEEVFDYLYRKVIDYYNNSKSKTYVFDGFAGADEEFNLGVRFIVKKAWQAHFVHNMFIRPDKNQLENFSSDFTIINASDVKNIDYKEHGMNSDAFVVFHLQKKIAIIGGTEYGGEMKKK